MSPSNTNTSANDKNKEHAVLCVHGPDRTGFLRDIVKLVFKSRLNIVVSRTHVLGDLAYVLLQLEGDADDLAELRQSTSKLENTGLTVSLERTKLPKVDLDRSSLHQFRWSSPDIIGLLLRITEPLSEHNLSIRDQRGGPNPLHKYVQEHTVLVTQDSDLQGFKQQLADGLEQELKLIPLGPREFDVDFPVA